MNERHVIVWDLDDTLGDFHALERSCEGDSLVQVRTRPGIEHALRALSDAGFVHSLLTMATPIYAEIALRGTGLRDFFTRVDCQGQCHKGDVAGVAASFGIPASAWRHQMIFVGDRPAFDDPADPEVVFHLEPCALTRPASDLEQLIKYLRIHGSGSIREGFLRLGRGARKWFPFSRRPPIPVGEPVRRIVRDLAPLLLLERGKECPVIGFEGLPSPGAVPDEHEFVPAEIAGGKPE